MAKERSQKTGALEFLEEDIKSRRQFIEWYCTKVSCYK